jgi:hypothetical protein
LGYSYVGEFLRSNFSLDQSLSKAIGFFVVAGLTQSFIGFLSIKIIKKIPYKFWKKPWNNLAAIAPALGQGIIIVSFILTLLISLPFAPKIKKDISDSRIGGFLVNKTSGFEAKTKEVFGGLAEDSLTYLTVRQGSRESTAIDYEVQELTVDSISENDMFNLINEERRRWVSPLCPGEAIFCRLPEHTLAICGKGNTFPIIRLKEKMWVIGLMTQMFLTNQQGKILRLLQLYKPLIQDS